MSLLQLSFILRLCAAQVEERGDCVGECGLEAVVGAKVPEQAVVRSDILIDPCRDQVLRAQLAYGRRKPQRAGLGNPESASSITKPVTPEVGQGSRSARTGCIVIKIEERRIERHRCRARVSQVCQW